MEHQGSYVDITSLGTHNTNIVEQTGSFNPLTAGAEYTGFLP